jgi:hypothetical protein
MKAADSTLHVMKLLPVGMMETNEAVELGKWMLVLV